MQLQIALRSCLGQQRILSLYPFTRVSINVTVDVLHEVFRHLSASGVMAVPKHYMFSIRTASSYTKEMKAKLFSFVRINCDYELKWFYLGTEQIIPPQITEDG